MSTFVIHQSTVDALHRRIRRLEDEAAVKDAALVTAERLLGESADLLARYHAATQAVADFEAQRAVAAAVAS